MPQSTSHSSRTDVLLKTIERCTRVIQLLKHGETPSAEQLDEADIACRLCLELYPKDHRSRNRYASQKAASHRSSSQPGQSVQNTLPSVSDSDAEEQDEAYALSNQSNQHASVHDSVTSTSNEETRSLRETRRGTPAPTEQMREDDESVAEPTTSRSASPTLAQFQTQFSPAVSSVPREVCQPPRQNELQHYNEDSPRLGLGSNQHKNIHQMDTAYRPAPSRIYPDSVYAQDSFTNGDFRPSRRYWDPHFPRPISTPYERNDIPPPFENLPYMSPAPPPPPPPNSTYSPQYRPNPIPPSRYDDPYRHIWNEFYPPQIVYSHPAFHDHRFIGSANPGSPPYYSIHHVQNHDHLLEPTYQSFDRTNTSNGRERGSVYLPTYDMNRGVRDSRQLEWNTPGNDPHLYSTDPRLTLNPPPHNRRHTSPSSSSQYNTVHRRQQYQPHFKRPRPPPTASRLPSEVLTLIFSFLRNPLPLMSVSAQTAQRAREQMALYSCMRVARSWRDPSALVMWRDPHIVDKTELTKLILCIRFTKMRGPDRRVYRWAYPPFVQNITRLDLREIVFTEPEDSSLLKVIANTPMPRLRVLRLRFVQCDEGTVERMLHGREVRYLSLFVTGGSVQRSLGALRSVSSNVEAGVGDESMAVMTEKPQLKVSMSRLRGLDLYQIKYSRMRDLFNLASMSLSSSLRYLNLGRTWIPDTIVTSIVHTSPNLESIWLEENGSLTDVSIHAIAQTCGSLRVLKLRNCSRITDAAITEIALRCPRLEALGISYTRCTDASLLTLAENSENLHTLFINDLALCDEKAIVEVCRMRGDRLRTLGMCGLDAVVGDNVLDVIVECCAVLEQLDVGGCAVTEAGLRRVAEGCRRLRTCAVDEDKLTAEFMRCLRTMRISTDQFWLEPPMF
ncbi:hypothetical protein BJ742DRAFT_875300 [Cladochytrium replicatum]|nr:hypothetical protein BJ742DRAFT_875300 [Cladochytrium replicatum]